jgi:hypothetical protein
VWRAKPCRLAGAGAAVAPQAEVLLRKPPDEPCQQPPGEVRRRLMPPPRQTLPLRGAAPGRQARERPGPCRDRQLHEHRHHHPCTPPAIGGIAVARPPPTAMPSLAQHVRARTRGDGLIARQERRAWRDHMAQQARDPPASQRPGRPTALCNDPVIGRHLPRSLLTPGPQQVGVRRPVVSTAAGTRTRNR